MPPLMAVVPPTHEPCKKLPGTICTVAGTGVGGFERDGVPADTTQVYFPQSVALTDWNGDGTLDLAFVDWNNHRIRLVYIDAQIDGIPNKIISLAVIFNQPSEY